MSFENIVRGRALLPWRVIALIAVGAATATALAGCPGTLDLTPFTVPACTNAPTDLLAPTCATAGCHSGAMAASSLDLSASGIPSLAGKMGTECAGLLVDPANPKMSVLYLKVTGACGSRMPLSAAPLTDAQTSCLLSWIQSQSSGTAGSGGAGAGGAGAVAGAGGAGGMSTSTATSTSSAASSGAGGAGGAGGF